MMVVGDEHGGMVALHPRDAVRGDGISGMVVWIISGVEERDKTMNIQKIQITPEWLERKERELSGASEPTVRAGSRETAWVIERDIDGRLFYWNGRPAEEQQWTPNHEIAVRFTRQSDADAMLSWHCCGEGRVVEHVWISSAHDDKQTCETCVDGGHCEIQEVAEAIAQEVQPFGCSAHQPKDPTKYCKGCREAGAVHCSDPANCGGPWDKKYDPPPTTKTRHHRRQTLTLV